MTAPDQMLRVFYSWQTDLPDAVNRNLIRAALNASAAAFDSDPSTKTAITIDEATRDLPGSPNIATAIFEKIRGADVFVADLTKVAEHTNYAGHVRKYCNSTVAIELGYAIRVLGWDRIIIVFNEAYGTVSDDLPFDARGHRISLYCCQAQSAAVGSGSGAGGSVPNATGHLRTILIAALKLIAEKNPTRPEKAEADPAKAITRERDVQQLREVFEWVDLGLMDRFIDELGYGRVLYVGEGMYQRLDAVVASASFHITDPELHELVVRFRKAWGRCFRYFAYMDTTPLGTSAYFKMPGDIPTSPEQYKQFQYTTKQWKPLRSSLDALTNYVRKHYLEIDARQSGKQRLEEIEKGEEELVKLRKQRFGQ